jgi:DNA-binding response OmpR family regulator
MGIVNKPRILIADDYADSLEMLEKLFCLEEYCCDLANDGMQAIGAWEVARTEQNPYELLILDAAMPNKTGFEVAGHLREQGDQTPVIILTGGIEPMMRPHAANVKAELVFKPFDASALKSKVAQLIQDAKHGAFSE